jgi:hypothetical protein
VKHQESAYCRSGCYRQYAADQYTAG